MSKGYDQLTKKFSKNNKLFVLANEYANQAMWSYIEDYKDEFKKPNPVDKMRHRAIAKQCYKRAKRELSK